MLFNLNQFPVDFDDILASRIFDSNTMKSVQARKPPTCSRCRNHGIYGVQLKGHRNVCKYKLCNCRNCRLIVERRLVHDVVRPSQPTPTGPRRKSTRKEHAPRKLETMEDRRNTREETSNKATSINCLPTFSHGNDTSQAQRTFMSPRLFNSGEASNIRQASTNLSHLQFPPNCPRLSNPPRPYGYLHCYPRLRNFSPTLPPNITVGPTSVPRMLGSPVPDQLNMFLNYSGSHRDVTNQGFAERSSQTSATIQRQMERY
ncbi:PREDICTED: doublesex- and mab-3-related transcription factor 1-like isoform X2 [Acropora digitifera]|uniref:doublesex- and mab-3-related transcription factor 1-like isoform X2 n=1 Tax=Acropora digitifera TaxID=70779 RepID=UPI00077A01D8|nr:PREDICTED: doublesex- and mab-3-related transcription factor 1-like isoform X2 [Acropora digitifera]